MSAADFALGIDLGTSHTVAMLRWPDGRVKPLLFDSSPLLPSAVYAPAGDGDLIVGRDALQHARFAPGRLEPNPKRRIDEVQVLLGDREVAVTALLAALLRHVHAEARRVAGGADPTVAIAHPAGWGPVRRLVLADAAEAAGLGPVTFVAEPVAAAHFFTAVDHHRVPAGSALVVYDFGGGTFDATVIRDSAGRFEVAAVDGLGDVGGVDIDAAVVEALRTAAPPAHGTAWKRLTEPATMADTRARHLLWEDVRTGKEMLSRATTVNIQVPTVDDGTTVSRADLERIAGPLVDRTVRTAGSLIRHAGLAPDRVAAVFLVGGSSRMPLVSRALHAALGVPPTVTEQPELVVAEGALYALPDDVTTAAPTSPAQPSPALRPAAVAGAAGPPAPGPAGPPAPGPAAVAGPDGPAAPGTPWAADAPTVPRLRAGGAAPAVPLLAGPPTPSAPHRSPAPHPPVGPPAAARRRGHGFAVVLAALTTAILLICAGLVSGVIGVPRPTGPADAADRPSASAPAVATGGPMVPPGWLRSLADPLTKTGQWTGIVDQLNHSECSLLGQLKVERTGPGTYRCRGPQTTYDDVAIEVDITLAVAGACGGVWFRFGLVPGTSQEAGYLLKVCEASVALSTHGVPDTARITDVWTHDARVTVGRPVRVGILARDSSIRIFLDGRQVGTVTDSTFHSGRVIPGIVVQPPADAGTSYSVLFRDVAFWRPPGQPPRAGNDPSGQ